MSRKLCLRNIRTLFVCLQLRFSRNNLSEIFRNSGKMNSLKLLSATLIPRVNCQFQRTMLSASYINRHHLQAYDFYKRTRNAKADKDRIQKLYKKSGLKNLSWSFPNAIIFSVEDEKDLQLVGQIVKKYIVEIDPHTMKAYSDPRSLLANFFWMCYTLNDVETAKSIGTLEQTKSVFSNERGHILNQYMTVLYDNECYQDVVDICDTMLGNSRSQVQIMLAASLCQIGTKEAYEKLLSYNSKFDRLQYRIQLLIAYFALEQKDFNTCFKCLEHVCRGNPAYHQFPPKLAPTNLFTLCNLRSESVEAALNQCQKWIENIPDEGKYQLMLCTDVYGELESEVKTKPELKESWDEFSTVMKSEGGKGFIHPYLLKDYLFQPLDLAPNEKKKERKEKYELILKERNLYRGAKFRKSTQDLMPEN